MSYSSKPKVSKHVPSKNSLTDDSWTAESDSETTLEKKKAYLKLERTQSVTTLLPLLYKFLRKKHEVGKNKCRINVMTFSLFYYFVN